MTLGRLLLLLSGLVIALGAVALVAHAMFIPWLIHRQDEVLVPEFTGMKLEQAEEQARHVGLAVIVSDEVFEETSLPGTVLEQVPGPLRSVRRGRAVRLTVSKGEALLRVPDLLGMSLRQGEITLLRDNLDLGMVARSYDPRGGVGIAAQRPHPGTEVPRGTRVAVVLREGNERLHFKVPKLIGRSLVRVRDELSTAGFELRRITYAPDREAFPGTILEQWPPAGSRLPRGGSIELVASTRN